MAWLNLTIPNQTVKNGLKAKKIKLTQMNFSLKKTTNNIFRYLLALSFSKIFKKFLEPIQSSEYAIFGPKMTHLSWTKFFGTNHYYYIHLLALFIVQNLKKSYSRSWVMRNCHFWVENGPFAQNGPNNFFFFWKIVNIILVYLLAPFIRQN